MSVKLDSIHAVGLQLNENGMSLTRGFRVHLDDWVPPGQGESSTLASAHDLLALDELAAVGIRLWVTHELPRLDGIWYVHDIIIDRWESPADCYGRLMYGQGLQTQVEVRGSTVDEVTMVDRYRRPLFAYALPPGQEPSTDMDKEDRVRVQPVVVKRPSFTLLASRVYNFGTDDEDSGKPAVPGFTSNGPLGLMAYDPMLIPAGTDPIAPDAADDPTSRVAVVYPLDLPALYEGTVNNAVFCGRPAGTMLCSDVSLQRVAKNIYRISTAWQFWRWGWDKVLFPRDQFGAIPSLDTNTEYADYLNDPVGFHTYSVVTKLEAFNNLPANFARPKLYPAQDFTEYCNALGYEDALAELGNLDRG